MKKLIFLGFLMIFSFLPAQILAQTPSPVPAIRIDRPANTGFPSISNAVSNILTLAFAIAVFIVLIMLIIGAYEWITSGGDKENVAKARNRIINALVGLLILAIAFALVRLIAQFTGLNLTNLQIPGPSQGPAPSDVI